MASSPEARPTEADASATAETHVEAANALKDGATTELEQVEPQPTSPASSSVPVSGQSADPESSRAERPALVDEPTSGGDENNSEAGGSDSESDGSSGRERRKTPTPSPKPAVEEATAAEPPALPPLPNEPLPAVHDDDGWDPMWSDAHQAWYFFNRFTQQTQWENPRVPEATGTGAPGTVAPVAGGYNPAIHGDYDPNAWYAKGAAAGGAGDGDDADGGAAGVLGLIGRGGENGEGDSDAAIAAAAAAAAALIQNSSLPGDNSVSGRPGRGGGGRGRKEPLGDEDTLAGRQLNGYFDVTAAAGAHEGRSLKAERSGKKPTRSELKAFKEKRRMKKEEKRRAWLRD
ncbi:WW/Rsp5/WWP domain protein [Niveomyces insectorum RCEF 264]|uniref:WW/Rsp5/WWP domain protein n=1 Tax=Niveomyces insectorum RCEF 264 TaxID=1081102 RepID=A0A167RFZ0_9HYPO|nr:WW/Rsp5/WWP domain protein [Niveomyces insectorum RCEF 264]